MKNKLLQLVKRQKYLFLLGGLIFFMLVLVGIIIATKKTPQSIVQPRVAYNINQPNQVKNSAIPADSKQSTKPFNLFSWLFPSKAQNTTQQTQSTQTGYSQAQPAAQQSGTSNSVSQSTGQIKTQPTAMVLQLGQGRKGTQQATQQAPSQTQTTDTTGATLSNNPNTTSFQIVFVGPDGQLQTYVPPDSPPIQVTWARYIDVLDKYAVDYPSNWQLKKQVSNGHNGISLFLPTANVQDPNQQYVGFGWSSFNLFPANDSSTKSYATSATVTGVVGTLYTQGRLGNSYIITIFPYKSGYFGIGSTASDPAFAYVYQHMLQSLTFNSQ